MHVILRNRRNTPRTLLVLAILSTTAPAALLNKCWADRAFWTSQQTTGRLPKLRQVVDLPEEYYGREFTYTVWISTHGEWMVRGANHFYIAVHDGENTRMPPGHPDFELGLFRFVLSKADGNRLLGELSATRTYQARVRFRVERQRAVFGAWQYLGMISSVEIIHPAKQ